MGFESIYSPVTAHQGRDVWRRRRRFQFCDRCFQSDYSLVTALDEGRDHYLVPEAGFQVLLCVLLERPVSGHSSLRVGFFVLEVVL